MSPQHRERFGRRCDALVNGGLIVLLMFSPLAIGSVHAWSQAIVEALVAALVIVWASKVLACGTTTAAIERLRRWGLPLACFGGVALVQLMPLPPAVLRVLSPHTFAVYRDNLPGWPETTPFAGVTQIVAALREGTSHPLQVAPSAPTDSPDLIEQVSALAQRLPHAGTWRPVSVYPYRSGEELLRMLTWTALFFCSSRTRGKPAIR